MARLLLVGVALAVAGCSRATVPAAAVPRCGGEGPGPVRHRIAHTQTRATLERAGIDPDSLPCNTDVRWVPNLDTFARGAADEVAAAWGVTPDPQQRKQATKKILGYLVRTVFQETQPHNLGVVRLRGRSYRDAAGRKRPLLVFRSAVTTDAARPGSCLQALIARAGVKHVVNLYAGDFPLHDLVAAEKATCGRLGATHHDEAEMARPWRELIKEPAGYQANLQLAMQRAAELIKVSILRPEGKPPRGNIYLHCGGGMHRSGMIFGILRRCINDDPMTAVEAEYKRHTGQRSSDRPGGAEELNLRFIRDFDCALLR